jgi:hypothetical protein
LTLKEIGRRLGVTREWVRKIELRAVRKLDDRTVGSSCGGPPRPNRRRPLVTTLPAQPVETPPDTAKVEHRLPSRPRAPRTRPGVLSSRAVPECPPGGAVRRLG